MLSFRECTETNGYWFFIIYGLELRLLCDDRTVDFDTAVRLDFIGIEQNTCLTWCFCDSLADYFRPEFLLDYLRPLFIILYLTDSVIYLWYN